MGGELNRGRCYQHDRVQTASNVLAYWHRLLLFVERLLSMCGSSFDLQFSLYDKSDDENAVNVKDKVSNERYRPIYHKSIRYVYYDDSLFLFYGLLWAPSMFHHSVWSVIIVDSRYSGEA